MSTIVGLSDQDCRIWDTYVQNAACGLPQHLSGWREVLRDTYGYETPYLMAREGERVVGVLPFFVVRSAVVGARVATMPGGLCADSDEVAEQLIGHGREIARQAKGKHLHIHDTRTVWPGQLHTTSDHVHWVVDVRLDVDALWKRLHGNIRRQVRIARRNQLAVEVDRTGEHLGACYEVLSRFTHQIGTPLFGPEFLKHIVRTFPEGFNIAVVFKQHQPIGAYFQLQMGQTVYGLWGGALRQYLGLRPVYLAYWEIIKDASVNGYEFLDMGRSPAGSKASKYKGQWGGVAKPIYQQLAGVDDTYPGNGGANGILADGRLELIRRFWPRLPLPVAQYLGPKLRRHVPFA